jgi:tartrate dehydrogenase/decarboxylase/D-malate dehydrogenase
MVRRIEVKSYKIAVIPGDGIGNEVIAEGIKVLQAMPKQFGLHFEFTQFPWGSAYYLQNGRMMPANGLDILKPFHAIYFGAVGVPEIKDYITLHGLILALRKGFDQYVCLRPCYLYEGVVSPLAGKKAGDIDLVVIRENTEGEYADIGGNLYPDKKDEVAIQTAVFTRHGTERIIRYAFDLARKRNKKRKVTSITKSNAQQYSMTFWDRIFLSVASDYADIKTESLLVDAACMDFVRRPESFDVVVASNLFGDILSDIGACITGSLGMGPSANIDPERRYPSMFEPSHGSAPDIAGKGIANPLATILSAGMMLDHLGEEAAAAKIRQAVAQVLADGKILTPDLKGHATTREVGNAIVDCLNH